MTGLIYTFYSYKGGVGRSMALANVAEYFYLRGLRVAIIDWDLEAPGLESFFYDAPPAAVGAAVESESGSTAILSGVDRIRCRLGLIDMLTEYKRTYREFLEHEQQSDFGVAVAGAVTPLRKFLHPVHPNDDPSGAVLWLLPAGWRGEERFVDYAKAVQAFDWTDFYASYRGKEYFDWVAAELRAIADVILIDSRTGVTEMGGVCARQMADVVVSFCAPNFQNVDGVDRMTRSFDRPDVQRERGDRRLQNVIVPTRVEGNESERLARFVEHFQKTVDVEARRPQGLRDVNASFWTLRIPYVSAYAFEEKRVFGPPGEVVQLDKEGRLEAAYDKLATHLALLAPEAHPIRQKMADKLRADFPMLLPPLVLSYAASDASEMAARANSLLQAERVNTWPALEHRPGLELHSELTIRQTKFVAVIATPATFESSQVEDDVRHARRHGKHVCVLVDELQKFPPAPLWLHSARAYSLDYSGITALLNDIRNPVPAWRVPNMAPPLPEAYVRREEVERQLRDALRSAAAVPSLSIVGLWGIAGSGKTAVAAQVSRDREIENTFPGGVLWLRGYEMADLRQVAERVYAEITGEAVPPDTSKVFGAVRDRLDATNTLIVLDDATGLRQVETLRELTARGVLLVITRDLFSLPDVSTTITVASLSDDQSKSMIESWPVEMEPDETAEVLCVLRQWPVGAALLKTSIKQRMAQGDSITEAWRYVRDRIRRHGVIALDPQGSAGLSSSMALESLLVQLASRDPLDRRRLVSIAERFGVKPFTTDAATTVLFPAQSPTPVSSGQKETAQILNRLSTLGVLLSGNGTAQLNALIYFYLQAQGIIVKEDGKPTSARKVSGSRDKQSNPDIDLAKKILAGQHAGQSELLALAGRLKIAHYFGYARRILLRARRFVDSKEERLRLAQHLALLTYKDEDLIPEDRFTRALAILDEADPLAASTNQESLGLAGAIHKYWWQFDGQRERLEKSYGFYRRGYAESVAKDYGYTGINAAFVLDLLAAQDSSTSLSRRAEARRIREEIATTLAAMVPIEEHRSVTSTWWFQVTLAEACFGLGVDEHGQVVERRYDEARYWLREALAQTREPWEYETTARQLAAIANLHAQFRKEPLFNPDSASWRTLRIFLSNRIAPLRSVAIGKVGLGLSGGGFRASLFHIGVLARLAEIDVLRHVEVLSCVSGGSIIGVQYYLELRQLLQSKTDASVTREDYVNIVKRLEHEFVSGVQKNLRTRVAANPWVSLRAALGRHYTRTRRLGELYEKHLFSRVDDDHGDRPRWINDLYIQPAGEPDDFSPRLDNWWRAAKVPELILNATALNTGHNWQFTASWMGEPPGAISEEVDGNDRLRRMYYWEAPEKYREIRLGHAVAASSSVPGLFEPLSLPGLYPGRTLQLVDGGVHDNQGIAALMEQDCKVLVVSDASGQMANEAKPRTGLLQVPRRANDILMGRVREAQYKDMAARRDSLFLRGLMYVHLKKDLQSEPVDWIGCDDPLEIDDTQGDPQRNVLTSYGILKHVQEQLAAVRTDLDSFSDLEAYALMYSGYKMTERDFDPGVSVIPVNALQPREAWDFLRVEPLMGTTRGMDEEHRALTRNLKVAKNAAFKPWRISSVLTFGLPILLGLLLVLSIGSDGAILDTLNLLLEVGLLGCAILTFVPGIIFVSLIAAGYRLLGSKKSIPQMGLNLIMVLLAPLFALHLYVFDRVYLDRGKLPGKK